MDRIWFLEGFADGKSVSRVPLLRLPFVIGRRPGLDLTIPMSQISQRHAEISLRDGQLMLRDLGSTNGTFLNQSRLSTEAPIERGDVLHFARLEFQLGLFQESQTQAILGSTTALTDELPKLLIERTRMLRDLIRQRAVKTLYQPIVDLATSDTIGYEALGRGAYDGLPVGLGELFEIAAIVGAEDDLNKAFRAKSIDEVGALPAGKRLFINTHPAELRDGRLVASLTKLREAAAERALVLEIHEAAVTDPPALRQLRNSLDRLKIGIAYDDFGAGQARILELAEEPPDYLKFDIKLVHEIQRSESRLKVTQSLVQLATELGVQTIAEGLETAGEVAMCHQLGFTHGQGFFLGKPKPLGELAR